MAKDNREILHGIRIPVGMDAEGNDKRTKLFTPGMEDELAVALSQADLDAAVERGDLSGDWKHMAKAKADAKAKE